MIEQAAGGGDEHVHAAIELLVLVVERGAADQERHVQLVVLAVALEAFRHLGGQFAGGLQDERAGHAGLGAAAGQELDHRESEGGGLAGAGLGDADDVAALKHHGNALCLDGGGDGVAAFRHRLQDVR